MSEEKKNPLHVAIIMDGNGRWAKQKRLPRAMGHKAGVERVRDIVKACPDRGVTTLTLYAFSTENWKRPKDEVGLLMGLLLKYIKGEVKELDAQGVCLRIIGDLSGLSEPLRAAANEAYERTKHNTRLNLNVAVNYGSRAEILRAAKTLAEKSADGQINPADIDEEVFSSMLYVDDPDLIIRTSGEKRLSNFMLWQCAYSEFYFTDVHWPDFDKAQLDLALADYAHRGRRFGGL